jgi:hypothetical protein
MKTILAADFSHAKSEGANTLELAQHLGRVIRLAALQADLGLDRR